MMEAYQSCKRILMKKVRNKTATAFLLTFFWGMIAHSYGLLHSSFIHDGLNAVYIEESERLWKMAIGRIFVNLYRDFVRGNWAVPWLIGIISLVFIAISVRLIVEMFDIETLLGFSFLSGNMVVNKTVTSLAATYILRWMLICWRCYCQSQQHIAGRREEKSGCSEFFAFVFRLVCTRPIFL